MDYTILLDQLASELANLIKDVMNNSILVGINRPKRNRSRRGRTQAKPLTQTQDLNMVIDQKWVEATLVCANQLPKRLFGPVNMSRYTIDNTGPKQSLKRILPSLCY